MTSSRRLAEAHKNDPAVASAVVRDEVNLHLRPGRTTEVFYRLAEGDKVQLLERATLPKPVTAGAAPVKTADALESEAVPPVAMEDWWLARDARGRLGWLLSHYVDVDAPDSLTRYAEGQRFVGAYVLTTVHDDGAEQDNKDIPIYLAVLGPYTAGLPVRLRPGARLYLEPEDASLRDGLPREEYGGLSAGLREDGDRPVRQVGDGADSAADVHL